jgi:hypothetical protein
MALFPYFTIITLLPLLEYYYMFVFHPAIILLFISSYNPVVYF